MSGEFLDDLVLERCSDDVAFEDEDGGCAVFVGSARVLSLSSKEEKKVLNWLSQKHGERE